MKKDLHIPEVQGVWMAACLETATDTTEAGWYVYLINNNDYPLDHILLVSKGLDPNTGDQVSSLLRKHLPQLAAHSAARIEWLPEALLAVDNVFQLSYFAHNTLYDRSYRWPAHSIPQRNPQWLPILERAGVVGE